MKFRCTGCGREITTKKRQYVLCALCRLKKVKENEKKKENK